MFKNQSKARQLYSALGGKWGVIALIVIIVVLVVAVVMYIRKKNAERQLDEDDFLRYMRLIMIYLKNKRTANKFEEQRVEFNLNRFKFTEILYPVGDEEQNLTWSTDSSVFGDLCNNIMGMVSYGSDPTSKYYKNDLLWRQVKHSIRVIAAKLPSIPIDNTVPWGSNWYQFSITYPLLLVSTVFSHYKVFNRDDAFMTRHLSSYMKNYFKEYKNPYEGLASIGWRRYESNVIGMSVPLIGGRLYSKRFDPEANSQKYARNYMTAEYVYTGNGFYYDNTYVTHVSRNDGYTTSFYSDFLFIFEFYRMKTRFFKVLHKNFSILEHPTIPLHHGPWFSRTGSLKGFEPGRKFATYGIDLRGYGRAVCVRTKQVSLHYNGQLIPLAAYESDRVNKEWAQCWVFMRRPMTINTSPTLYPSLVPYYDGVHSYGRIQINWPSTNTTTTTFQPSTAQCSLCYHQDKVAGMYNKYSIEMASSTYKFSVEEFNMVTPEGFHVMYTCMPDTALASTSPYTIAVHLGKLDENQEVTSGIGENHSYAFDNYLASYLYLETVDEANADQTIKLEQINDPDTSRPLDALFFQPITRSIFKFGFSNIFSTPGSKKRYNNLTEIPTMNVISTEHYRLEKVDNADNMILLYNYKDKTVAISYSFNYTLPKSISIAKSILDSRFESYEVLNSIYEKEKSEYLVDTYERQYQIELINVVFRN